MMIWTIFLIAGVTGFLFILMLALADGEGSSAWLSRTRSRLRSDASRAQLAGFADSNADLRERFERARIESRLERERIRDTLQDPDSA
jgi:hypothetical protein